MSPRNIAQNIVNGNRSLAAGQLASHTNPANTALHVVDSLIDDHGWTPDRAIRKMISLTGRDEFYPQEES
jgi:hypothetical protein